MRWVCTARSIRAGLVNATRPVDACSLAASVALRDLAHACQRVRPAPQHQFLQVPDLGPVTIRRRLEDPAPQPPYVLLVTPPFDGVPHRDVLRSVHSEGRHRNIESKSRHLCLTCPSVRVVPVLSRQWLTRHTSACFRSRAPGPVSGQLYDSDRSEDRSSCCRFPVAFQLPAFASWASCSRTEFSSPHGRPTTHALKSAADRNGVSTFHTRETRPGRVPS